MTNIAIFASGSGTNAENIIKHFSNSQVVNIQLIITNNKRAGVIKRGEKHNIPVYIVDKDIFYNKVNFMEIFGLNKIDYIILAGFLLLIPSFLIENYKNKIINIHPALLPSYGGKGMYGMNVHKAVIANKEKKSGITIHFVNEKYDEGKIIFQEKLEIMDNETPDSLANKIHKLEYKYFPVIIEKLINGEI